MSESLEGVSVAATRQNAGSAEYCCAALPRPAPPGGTNAPAAMVAADVTVAFCSDKPTRLSHDAPAASAVSARLKSRPTDAHANTVIVVNAHFANFVIVNSHHTRPSTDHRPSTIIRTVSPD